MISIVIPAFNEEQNIGRCLESLTQQTVPRDEYEIIVVDGGSRDRTREIAGEFADLVFIQESARVGGARNDGIRRAKGKVVATTDADCIIPPRWVAQIRDNFRDRSIVQLYGPVTPIEPGFRNRTSLALANTFSHIGYLTGMLYYTLGCNTAFDKEAFFRAGMYHCIDAGDDLEIAHRMRQIGRIYFDRHMSVGFSMRRYQQFGTIRSLWEWLYIVAKGGSTDDCSYTRREYR